MRKNGSTYNKGFKSDAVRLVIEEGYSAAEAARNLGVSKRTLRDWIKKNQSEASREKIIKIRVYFPGEEGLPDSSPVCGVRGNEERLLRLEKADS